MLPKDCGEKMKSNKNMNWHGYSHVKDPNTSNPWDPQSFPLWGLEELQSLPPAHVWLFTNYCVHCSFPRLQLKIPLLERFLLPRLDNVCFWYCIYIYKKNVGVFDLRSRCPPLEYTQPTQLQFVCVSVSSSVSLFLHSHVSTVGFPRTSHVGCSKRCNQQGLGSKTYEISCVRMDP